MMMMGSSMMATAAALLCGTLAAAQDPAQGWLGYAKGVSPSGGRVTSIEAKWVNLNNPQVNDLWFSFSIPFSFS
jgi:hypothetical protein